MAEVKEQRTIDREVETAFQQAIIDAVAARNQELIAGADPDPNVGTDFYDADFKAAEAANKQAFADAKKAS